ncbi:MAG: sigma-70 family RNA polymerase sigma factor [Pseudomonadota bacterium]|nr:sigma-70 family RNA polymerase sigma factor [Pseudomonadota bacterium]
MNATATPDVTRLLREAQSGNSGALEAILPIVYNELRRLARHYLRSERHDHTLQPTALVHEAYLRLIDQHSVDWENRAHFFAIAAQMMRRILVNHAEAHRAAKRGAGAERLTLSAADDVTASGTDVVALDDALRQLEKLDARQAQIVELRYFGGLNIEEVASALALSPATIKREWATAKVWLKRELTA